MRDQRVSFIRAATMLCFEWVYRAMRILLVQKIHITAIFLCGASLLSQIYFAFSIVLLMAAASVGMKFQSFEAYSFTFDNAFKAAFWLLIGDFVMDSLQRLRYDGVLAFCSPYNRRITDRTLMHYYTLVPRHELEISHTTERGRVESFETSFPIESCILVFKFERSVNTGMDALFLEWQRPHQFRENENSFREVVAGSFGGGRYGSSSSRSFLGLDEISFWECKAPSGDDSIFLQAAGKETVEAAHEVTAPSVNGANSFAQAAGHDLVAPVHDRPYNLRLSSMDCLQVDLVQSDTQSVVHSYTYYNTQEASIREVQGVMDILEKEGNILFASFSHYHVGRDGAGSGFAHSYQLDELLNCLLQESYRVGYVSLEESVKCRIGNRLQDVWSAVPIELRCVLVTILTYALAILSTALFVAGLFYPGQKVVLVTLAVFALLLDITGRNVTCVREGAKTCVYHIIRYVAPNSLDTWYKLFQKHLPWLAYKREGCGYPKRIRVEEVCFLMKKSQKIPVCFPTANGARVYDLGIEKHFNMDLVGEGVFDLGHVQIKVIMNDVRTGEDDSTCVVEVEVEVDNSPDDVLVIVTRRWRLEHLLVLLHWLVDHRNGVGVCKDWSAKATQTILTYTCREIVELVLNGGMRAYIRRLPSAIDVSVV